MVTANRQQQSVSYHSVVVSPALFTNIQSKRYSDLGIICLVKGIVDIDPGLNITECNLTSLLAP